MDETLSFPNAGTAIKDAIKEAAKNPRINFGSLYQISDTPIFLLLSPLFSTFVAKNTATANAINPIRIFWMDFTRTAAVCAVSPSAVPATVTAPVESTVPPIRAPPISSPRPVTRISTGSNTIISTVKMIDIDTVSERSFFFALLAAPTAIAADVPHTEVAVARVMTNGLLSIFKTLVPNHHMKRMTIGVTIHAIPIP